MCRCITTTTCCFWITLVPAQLLMLKFDSNDPIMVLHCPWIDCCSVLAAVFLMFNIQTRRKIARQIIWCLTLLFMDHIGPSTAADVEVWPKWLILDVFTVHEKIFGKFTANFQLLAFKTRTKLQEKLFDVKHCCSWITLALFQLLMLNFDFMCLFGWCKGWVIADTGNLVACFMHWH